MSRQRFNSRYQSVAVFMFILSLVALAMGGFYLFEYIRMISLHRFPLVTGHLVDRRLTIALVGSRTLVKIRVEDSDDYVYALLSLDEYVPHTVTFHYSGIPETEVYLEQESNPIWIALWALSGVPFLALIGYYLANGTRKPEQSGDADSIEMIRIDVWRETGWIVIPMIAMFACWVLSFLGMGLDQIAKNTRLILCFGMAAVWAAGALATCLFVPYRKAIVEVSPDGLTISNKGVSQYYSWGQIGRFRFHRILGWVTVWDNKGDVILRLDLNPAITGAQKQKLMPLLRDKTRTP